MLPLNRLFHKYSLSNRVYLPRSNMFSKYCTLMSSFVGSVLHLSKCSLTDVFFVVCSLNLLLNCTVVFPMYCASHLQVTMYMPESRQHVLWSMEYVSPVALLFAFFMSPRRFPVQIWHLDLQTFEMSITSLLYCCCWRVICRWSEQLFWWLQRLHFDSSRLHSCL